MRERGVPGRNRVGRSPRPPPRLRRSRRRGAVKPTLCKHDTVTRWVEVLDSTEGGSSIDRWTCAECHEHFWSVSAATAECFDPARVKLAEEQLARGEFVTWETLREELRVKVAENAALAALERAVVEAVGKLRRVFREPKDHGPGEAALAWL